MPRNRALVVLTLGAIVAPATVQSQPSVSVSNVAALTLDGNREAAWDAAAVMKDFTVSRPATGIAPQFSPVARVLTTDDALWFFIQIDVPEPEIYAPVQGRDDRPRGDFVFLQIDPWGDGRRGYGFTVNAAAVLADGTIDNQGQPDTAWDSQFDAATTIGPDGWTAEIRIPFKSLRFDPNQETWGAHIYVDAWKRDQTVSWAPIDLDVTNRLGQAGRIEGMGGHAPGRALEILPEFTSSWQTVEGVSPPCRYHSDVADFEACGTDLSYGIGVKYGLTPSLTADVVFNPDFSQIEADPTEITLNNRFALFLQERRRFFLEGRDIFETPLGVVYSRAIGQPDVAGKITGRTGQWRIGALWAMDGEPPPSLRGPELSGDPGTQTQVLRLQHDVGDGSVGFFLVNKDLGGDAFNLVHGVDAEGNITDHVAIDASTFISQTRDRDGVPATGRAARGKLTYKTEDFRLQLLTEQLTDDFRAEAGFIPRLGYTRGYAKADYYYRSENPWAQHVSPGIWVDGYLTQGTSDWEERLVGANTFWLFGGRTFAFTNLTHSVQRVDERDLGETSWDIAAGSSFLQWLQGDFGLNIATAIIRDPEILQGDPAFVGGQIGFGAQATLRPIPAFTVELARRQRILYDKLGGRELARQPVWRAAVQYFLLRDLDVRYIAEWREQEEVLTNDALLSYRPTPGSVCFLGYRETIPLEQGLTDRAVFLKLSTLFDF
jgi:hypothetical protein